MRKLTDVITQISALLPTPAPAEVQDEINVLRSELVLLARVAAYSAPESSQTDEIWARLGTALYRYLPAPARYPFAQQISDLVTQ
jgi:hypothetical protein